jgi:hypothetical protein
MKIALCLRGKVGNNKKYVLGQQSMDVANIGYKHWKENLLEHNDVDVFFHCWDKQFKDELISMYSPKGYIFQNQVNFGSHLDVRRFAIKSNWYSTMRAVDIMRKYEEKYDFKYDAVLLSRFDLALQEKIVMEEEGLDMKRFYHNGTFPIHKHNPEICRTTCCDPSSDFFEVGDLLFVANSDNMFDFTRIYDSLEEGKLDSNHMIAARHLRKLGLFDTMGNFMVQKKYDNFYKTKEDGLVPLVRWAYKL